MRVLIIENGVVANATALPADAVIAADGQSASWHDSEAEGATHIWPAPDGATLYASDTADIGWSVDEDGVPVAPVQTGMPTPSLASLAQATVAAAAASTNAIAAQVAPDQTHLAGYLNAAAIVGPGATVPAVEPLKSSFTALATANGYGTNLPGFASLVVGVASISLSLSALLTTVNGAVAAAKAPADLAAAIEAFETGLATLIASLNGAGLTISIAAPASIRIVGVNA